MMKEEIVCRQALAEDAISLAELRWAMRIEGGEEPAMQREEFLARACAYFGETTGSHWVAEMAGGVVGTLSLERIRLVPRPCRFDDAFGCITNLYVRPEVRGRGIAGTLLAHVIA